MQKKVVSHCPFLYLFFFSHFSSCFLFFVMLWSLSLFCSFSSYFLRVFPAFLFFRSVLFFVLLFLILFCIRIFYCRYFCFFSYSCVFFCFSSSFTIIELLVLRLFTMLLILSAPTFTLLFEHKYQKTQSMTGQDRKASKEAITTTPIDTNISNIGLLR